MHSADWWCEYRMDVDEDFQLICANMICSPLDPIFTHFVVLQEATTLLPDFKDKIQTWNI